LKPLLAVVSIENNQREIKSVLAVIEIFINNLGDVEKATAEVARLWDGGDLTFNFR
jgi:hypothetical protein